MTDKVEITRLKLEQLPEVAQIHIESFPGSALTALGYDTVYRYYHWLLTGPHHEVIALIAKHDGKLIGYNVSGRFRGALTGFIRKNRWFLLTRVILHAPLLLQPVFRERMRIGLRTQWWLLRSKFKSHNKFGHQAALVATANESPQLSIGLLTGAVLSAYRHTGAGLLLQESIEELARQRGYTHARLSVHKNNMRVVRFHRARGFEIIHEDENSLYMSKKL